MDYITQRLMMAASSGTPPSGDPMQINITGSYISLVLSGTVAVYIDWGDGTGEVRTSTGTVTRSYGSTATRDIKIYGILTGFNGFGSYAANVNRIDSWGDLGLTDLYGGCTSCINLTSVPNDIPSTVTTLCVLFHGCNTFNQNIGSWNTSNVINVSYMFGNCTVFNQNIGSWNTSNVTDMAGLFHNARTFNQNIGGWNTAKVNDLHSVFYNALVFNQNVGSWNTHNVTNLWGTFNNAQAFNQNIGSWNTHNVTNLTSTFNNAQAFNQNIGSWNTHNVTKISGMFQLANTFNQNIGSWNTSKIEYFTGIFERADAFNQNIGSWNTSNATLMWHCFYGALAFNQNIGSWNTSKVIHMSSMFCGTYNFNQDISSWNTANVVNMNRMFYDARSFNQDLSPWCVENVTDYSFFNDLPIPSVWTQSKPVWGCCPSENTFLDGKIYGIGENEDGRFGLNNRTDFAGFGLIGFPNFEWISVQCERTFVGVKTDGTLWTCGDNNYGRLGLNTTSVLNNKSTFTQVGSDTNWSKVYANNGFFVAQKTNGTLWSWGYSAGIYGHNILSSISTPTQIGLDTDWVDVCSVTTGAATSSSTTLVALKSNGTLWGCGENTYYAISEDLTATSTLTQIGTDTDWSKISGGNRTLFSIKTNGTLWCRGDNFYGQLGLNSRINKTTFTQVGSETNWSKVFCTPYQTFAIKANGTLWSCGNNSYGSLGLNISLDLFAKSTFTQVGTATNWADISLGCGCFFGLRSNGAVYYCGGYYLSSCGGSRSVPTAVGYFETTGHFSTVYDLYNYPCCVLYS
jgi:surface protein